MRCKYAKKERRDGVVKEKLHRPQGHTEQRLAETAYSAFRSTLSIATLEEGKEANREASKNKAAAR